LRDTLRGELEYRNAGTSRERLRWKFAAEGAAEANDERADAARSPASLGDQHGREMAVVPLLGNASAAVAGYSCLNSSGRPARRSRGAAQPSDWIKHILLRIEPERAAGRNPYSFCACHGTKTATYSLHPASRHFS
jgi:hypothetical protein